MKIDKLYLEGVGLLLFSKNGKILVLEELVSKPVTRKVSGMLTFPLETIESGETPNESLSRLLIEEVGNIKVSGLKKFGEFKFSHPNCRVQVHAFSAKVQREFNATPLDTDVVHHSWMHPQDLLTIH